jgi:hypothetical protein
VSTAAQAAATQQGSLAAVRGRQLRRVVACASRTCKPQTQLLAQRTSRDQNPTGSGDHECLQKSGLFPELAGVDRSRPEPPVF